MIKAINVISVIDFLKNKLRKSQKTTYFRLCVTIILSAILLTFTSFSFPIKVAYANDFSKTARVVPSSSKYAGSYNQKSKGISLKITKSTSILTDKSGYHISVELKNNGSKDLPEGKIQVTCNPWYVFVSRMDLQKWSQAESRIPTPQLIGEVSVPSLASGKSYNAQIDVDANNDNLSTILYWGPKPVSIAYSSLDFKHYSSIKTFVTRANIGIKNIQTPPINMTLLMPIVAKSSDWRYEINKQNISPYKSTSSITNETSKQSNSDSKKDVKQETKQESKQNEQNNSNNANNANGEATSIHSSKTKISKIWPNSKKIRLSKNAVKRVNSLINLVQKHPKLQTIADLNTLKSAQADFTPSAFMQNNGFNISQYAELNIPYDYKSAGVGPDSWSKKSSTLSDFNTKEQNIDSYALQMDGKWTLRSLEQARNNGYRTVIATKGFDTLASRFAVKTHVYNVQTSSGSIKVLSCQETLNDLANGYATSAQSAAESTSAGLLNRLAAQSAFYQMEQPYTPRHLLVTFSANSSISLIESVVSMLEKSPWINILDLNSLAQSKTISKEHLGYNPVPKESSIEGKTLVSIKTKINKIAKDRTLVERFVNSILDQKELNSNKIKDSDAQLLAKQNAKLKINQNSKIWSKNLLNLFDNMAQREISGEISGAQSGTPSGEISGAQNTLKDENNKKVYEDGTHTLAKMLTSGINIIPPKDVTLVSETATMPITISNTNPYPVSVYLTSYTNSMEIVTRRKTPIKVAANSETQVILPLRSTTSSKVKAIFALEDRNHKIFSENRETTITSTLQISDKSGTIIIIFAFALGALGLWRQFKRKKDPDE